MGTTGREEPKAKVFGEALETFIRNIGKAFETDVQHAWSQAETLFQPVRDAWDEVPWSERERLHCMTLPSPDDRSFFHRCEDIVTTYRRLRAQEERDKHPRDKANRRYS